MLRDILKAMLFIITLCLIISTSQAILNLTTAMSVGQAIEITGINDDSYFGFSYGTGNFNNDTYPDMVIGSYGEFNNIGAVYVLYGGPSIFTTLKNLAITTNVSSSLGFKISGNGARHYMGLCVGSAGDFNKDGFDDLIIGGQDPTTIGEVYIIYGNKSRSDFTVGTNLGRSIGFQMTGVTVNGWFGNSVAGIGDFNGDGYADVVIGAPKEYSLSGTYNTGNAYVIYGNRSRTDFQVGPNMGQYVGFRIASDSTLTSGYLGIHVASLGDLNKDGYSDILIGDWQNNAAYIIFGGKSSSRPDIIANSTMNTSIGFKIQGPSGTRFGEGGGGFGDINKDGQPDYAIGAPYDNNGDGSV